MRTFILLVITLLFAACGGSGVSVSGVYTGNDGAFVDSLNFKSGGVVELRYMGETQQGSYEIDGNQVKVTAAGDTQMLTIDSAGCLDGGNLLGKYCK